MFNVMCPGDFYNNINIIGFFVLNKSNVINFITYFFIRLYYQLHHQMQLVM